MGIVLREDSVIYNNGDSIERNKKEAEYLDYIKEHIAFVNQAFEIYMKPLLNMTNISSKVSDEALKAAINSVGENIDTHDASKFSDSEFDGYRAKWYPTQLELQGGQEYNDKVDERYEECWKHHYTVNAHHPAHWYDFENKVARDMTLEAIVEMLCDWEAMSLKFKTNTLNWYENDATDEKACFSLNSKIIIEDLLYNVLHNSVDGKN